MQRVSMNILSSMPFTAVDVLKSPNLVLAVTETSTFIVHLCATLSQCSFEKKCKTMVYFSNLYRNRMNHL